jgi:hypothetical protein
MALAPQSIELFSLSKNLGEKFCKNFTELQRAANVIHPIARRPRIACRFTDDAQRAIGTSNTNSKPPR